MPGNWQVIVPQLGVNLVTNPSFEIDLAGYSGLVAALTRVAGPARRGVWSLGYTPTSAVNDGVYYVSITLFSGTTYTFCVDFMGQVGVPYKIWFGTTGAALLGTEKKFIGTGGWQRVAVTYTEVSSTARKLFMTKDNSANTGNFFVDGVVCEASSSETTYIDGDQPGCFWNGAEHASTSSRPVTYRTGGRIIDLRDEYGLYINDDQGYGMPPVENIAIEYGVLDGALYQRTKVKPRILSLVGKVFGSSLANLHVQRDKLVNAFRPDMTGGNNPIQLRYKGAGTTRIVRGLLDDGLNGTSRQIWSQAIPLRFTAHDPWFYEDGESSSGLDTQDTGTLTRFVKRGANGLWDFMSGGANGSVFHIIDDKPRSRLIVVGDFTSIAGQAITRVAAYNYQTNTWTALYTTSGPGAIVNHALVAPNGDLYICGSFTSVDGVANTARIARWNGSAWSALGTGGADNAIFFMAFDTSGNLYAVGSCTQFGGVANTTRIARWNGSAWSALGTGLNNTGFGVTVGPDGNVYVTGIFSTANGVTVNGLAYWNGSTFVTMGGLSGGGGEGRVVAFSADGTLYVAGSFTTIGGVSCNNIARWNGSSFQPLGSGTSDYIYRLYIHTDGRIYASGDFNTVASNLAAPGKAAYWNGSSWLPLDIDVNAGGATITGFSIVILSDGTLYYGLFQSATSTAKTSGQADVPNTGSGVAYPTIVITGPSSGTAIIYTIANRTLKDEIHFDSGLVLNAGERFTLDLTPGGKSFKSNWQGNLIGRILRGSNTGTFRLYPGSNSISVFASNSTVTASIRWTNRYWSADGGAVAA